MHILFNRYLVYQMIIWAPNMLLELFCQHKWLILAEVLVANNLMKQNGVGE